MGYIVSFLIIIATVLAISLLNTYLGNVLNVSLQDEWLGAVLYRAAYMVEGGVIAFVVLVRLGAMK